jgi:Fe-S cluster assembly scaffold protein SufB
VHAAEESDAQVILEVGEAGTVIQRSTLGDNAQLHWHNVTLGTGKIEQSLVSQAKGVNASSSVSWLFYAKNKDEYQLTCRNIFDAQNGGGEIIMKGVSENTAHASAKGMIDIGLKGNGTDTYLTQNVLMLDSTSKVDAVPSLEIKTNDVKASHSATVSRVTEEDLFYFASRGIDAHEARGMYVQGFLADLTSSIRSSRASEAILGAIERKYAQKL